MKIRHIENKMAGVILGLTLLFGVGVGSIATGHVRAHNSNNNQDRGGRNWDGYPNWGGSFELRQTALNAGYNEGTKAGRNDRARGRHSNFQDFSAYQKATKDYNSRLGDRELYRRYFRKAFENGYNPELQTLPPADSIRSSRLSDSELNQVIQRIQTGEDTFRSSLTDAFGQSRYDQRTSEGNMNDAVRGLKNATDQLRSQFDARQPVADYVERVLARATPIDTYMRNNRLTNRAQNDWSTLRGYLNTLAGAYNLSANWQNGADDDGKDGSGPLDGEGPGQCARDRRAGRYAGL